MAKNIGTAITIMLFIIGGAVIYYNWSWIKSDFFHAYGEVPNFKLYDYLNRPHLRSEFSGYPLVINLWTVDNPFSSDELKELANIQTELGDKIIVIAINRGESVTQARGFTDRLGITGSLIFLMDPQDSFYKAVGGFQTPETVFVDREGNIVDHKRGYMKKPEIRQRIDRIL